MAGRSVTDRVSSTGVQVIAALTCVSLSVPWALFSGAAWAWAIVIGAIIASIITFRRLDRALRTAEAIGSAVADSQGPAEVPAAGDVRDLAPAE